MSENCSFFLEIYRGLIVFLLFLVAFYSFLKFLLRLFYRGKVHYNTHLQIDCLQDFSCGIYIFHDTYLQYLYFTYLDINSSFQFQFSLFYLTRLVYHRQIF